MTNSPTSPVPPDRMRIDLWLWAARFFRSRTLAQEAVNGGKVHLNGTRVKPGHVLKPGDRLEITRNEERFVVTVAGLNRRRGPAATASELYTETPESIQAREEQQALRRAQPAIHLGGRPTKRERRTHTRITTSYRST